VLALLLQAEDGQAVNASLAEAASVDEWQRHHILQTLRQLQETAGGELPAAARHMDALIKAWTGKYGSEPPRLRDGERIGGKPLPAAGTGAAQPRWGCAPVQG